MPEANNSWGIFEDKAQAEQHIWNRRVIRGTKMWTVNRITEGDYNHNTGRYDTAKLLCTNPNERNSEFAIDDPLFRSFRFDRLGWVNHPQGVVLTETIPVRQTRRGYGDENFGMWKFPRFGGGIERAEDVDSFGVMFSIEFEEMLADVYPDYRDVAYEVFRCDHRLAVAISRMYVIQSDTDGYTWLWRFSDRVGMLLDNNTIQLGRRFKYLKEEITESPCFGREVLVS